MDCKRLTNDLLLEGRDPHIAGCAACRARKAELEKLAAQLTEIGRADRTDAALVDRILAKLPPRRRFVARRASPWPWLAGAAAAAALVAVLVVATRPTPPSPSDVVVTPPPKPEPPRPPLPEPPRPEAPKPVPLPEPKPVPPPPSPEKPVVPEPPKPPPPAPVPAPEPKPAPAPPPAPPKPTETKPEVKLLAVAAVEGTVELAGKKLERGKDVPWDGELRATDRLARIRTADGVVVTLRGRTELQVSSVEPPALLLEQGEIFCDVSPKAGRRFAILTADGRVEVTGTSFSVKRTDHTEVVVVGGEVALSNEKGESRVPAGNGASLRKSSAPAKPRPVDVDRMAAWRRELDGPETARFRYDFEDGRRPYPWVAGKLGPGPARGLNRQALEAEGGSANVDLSRVDRRVPVYKPTLVVRFRYHVPAGTEIWVQFFCERAKDNFRQEVKPVAAGKWESVELPLADFYRLEDGSKLQDGDRFSWFNLNATGGTGAVWFDDIELVEVHKP